jgi:NNP family nitrate/nitrite transporter-like MFS transporter
MDFKNKATSINLLDFKTPQMRAFHVTWVAFFLAFFGWFGISPLMSIVREDLQLTQQQVGDTIIAGVFITIIARLIIGPVADRIGPRLAYSFLLIFGSLPVIFIGLSQDFTQFMIFRLLIGAIGASFVVTQFHTSLMFAPNVVGTANATTAGWGNLGGGVTQVVMPQIFLAATAFVGSEVLGWRIAMAIPGIALLLMGIAYYRLTQDAPDGNFKDLRNRGEMLDAKLSKGTFLEAAKDPRVWALFFIYAACFGIELTINGTAALYFIDYFKLDIATAGLIASLFGLMNIFARSLGGIVSDRFARNSGLRGRVLFMFGILFLEGITLILFSQAGGLLLAIPMLILFSTTVQMSEGATYGIVPFINKRALGSVSGIVGAGGNFGAVTAGFLFRQPDLPWPTAYLILGVLVVACSFFAFAVRFSEQEETAVKAEIQERMAVVTS